MHISAASHNGPGGFEEGTGGKTPCSSLSTVGGLKQDPDSPWKQGGKRTGSHHSPEKPCGHGQQKKHLSFPTTHTPTRLFLEFICSRREYFSPQRREIISQRKENKVAATTDVGDVNKSLTGWCKTKVGNLELNPGAKARGRHLSTLSTL